MGINLHPLTKSILEKANNTHTQKWGRKVMAFNLLKVSILSIFRRELHKGGKTILAVKISAEVGAI